MSKTLATLLVLLLAVSAWAVPHQSNEAVPTGGKRSIELEELWTVGGTDDEENLFGVITQVLVDEEGLVYLLDQQLSTVSVFSPTESCCGPWAAKATAPARRATPTT